MRTLERTLTLSALSGRVSLNGRVQLLELHLDDFLHLWDAQKPWAAPESEPFILPQKAPDLLPSLVFLEPEGEVYPQRMWRPPTSGLVRPMAKVICKRPGYRQVKNTSPRLRWAPAVALPTAIRRCPSCRRCCRMELCVARSRVAPPVPVGGVWGMAEPAGHRSTHDVPIFFPTRSPSCSHRRTVRGATPSTVAASATESMCIVEPGICGFPFLSFN